MCLHTKMTTKQCKEWLKEQPDDIIAYKVAWELVGEVYPPVYRNGIRYEKTNKLEKMPTAKSSYGCTEDRPGRSYKAGYHLALTKNGAKEFKHWLYGNKEKHSVILKCKIPKKAVVAVGTQASDITKDNPVRSNEIAIVTKEFTFTEGDRYFEKKEKTSVHK